MFALKSHTRKNKFSLITGLLLAGLAFFPTVASGQAANLLMTQDEILQPGTLTLDECLDLAMENNIGLMRTRLGIEAGILDRIRSETIFDPGFTLDFSYRHNAASGSSGGGGGSSSTDLGMGYQHPLWNGSSWSLSLDQSRSVSSISSGSVPTNVTSYSSQLGLAYSMPLLEGYGEMINRIGLEKSGIGITRSEIALADARRILRYSVIQAYIGAVLSAKQIEVANLSLDTAQNLVERVQAFIEVGQVAPYELLSAQSGLAQRQEAVLKAEIDCSKSLDYLKELVGLPLTDEISVDPGTLREIFLEIDADDLFLLAQKNRPDLEDLDLRIHQAQLDLVLATDRRQASLAWNTIFSLGGQEEAYGSTIGGMDRFNWYTGLEYRLPLGGNRAANLDVASVMLQLDQFELEKINFLRSLQLEIRSAAGEFHNALLRVDVTAQGLEVQEVKMESEYARLDLGLITSRDLLEFDLELANAMLSYEAAIADTITSLAKLEYLVNIDLIDDAVVIGGIQAEGEAVD